MKNFKKYVIVSLVMIFAVLFFMSRGVNASGYSILISNNTTNNTTSNVTNNTVANNTVVLSTTNTTTNVVKTNTINDASKDLPKTGENDVYIISAIGAVAIVVGIVAYAKSKKYDVR